MKEESVSLRKELGLGDLVLAQVLCVVGSSWVGIAAKLGRAHVVFWLVAMLMFYLPLAAVVIYLNRLMPLEGGLYQWAKAGLRRDGGLPDRLESVGLCGDRGGRHHLRGAHRSGIHAGRPAAWLPASKWPRWLLTGGVMAAITLVAVLGLNIGKWLHNAGSVMILLAYVILLGLPVWALCARLHHALRSRCPGSGPSSNWFSLAIFGQMTVGALSGFEYVAIWPGECRSAARTIGQSVIISAPIIARDVHPRHQLGAGVPGQPADQRDRARSRRRCALAFGSTAARGLRGAVRHSRCCWRARWPAPA